MKNFLIAKPTRFNLFVGENNSGKTSLLEAIFMHCAPVNFNVILGVLSMRHGGFLGNQKYIVDNLRWFFSEPEGKSVLKINIESYYNGKKRLSEIELEDISKNSVMTDILSGNNALKHAHFDTGSSAKSVKIELNRILDSEIEGIAYGILTYKFANKEGSVESRQVFDSKRELTILSPKIRTDIETKILSTSFFKRPESGVTEWDKAVKKRISKDAIEIMQKIDNKIIGAQILMSAPNTAELYVEYKGLGLMPLSGLGDGIRKMLIIALSLSECRNGVLLIDEIEQAIHYNALVPFLDWLMKMAKDHDVQVFATTHSLECIDALINTNINNLNDISLYKMFRENYTLTNKKISGPKLKTLRIEMGQDVRW
ncbi:MAG: ATP-binding protein [Pseudomonadota bacterium]